MSAGSDAARFLDGFAVPLLDGQSVHVGTPGGQPLLDRLQLALGQGLDRSPAALRLAQARQRRLDQLGGTSPLLPLADDPAALRLLLGLHDLLFLIHPAADRLSPDRLQTLAQASLAMLGPASLDCGETEDPWGERAAQLYGRHTLLAPLWQLGRLDIQRHHRRGHDVYRGTQPPRRWLPLGQPPDAQHRVQLLGELLGAADGLGSSLLRALLRSSPLTELLQPLRGVHAARLPCQLLPHANWLTIPPVARLLSRRYLELGLPTVGPLLATTLAARLAQLATSRRPMAGGRPTGEVLWLRFSSHLQLCAHVIADSPLPAASAPPALLDFYGLYAALYAHRPDLALPADVAADAGLQRLVELHVQRCQRLVGPPRLKLLSDLCTRGLGAAPE